MLCAFQTEVMQSSVQVPVVLCLFFFNDTATTEIYTLSLHDALPIWSFCTSRSISSALEYRFCQGAIADRKSTRLNSSHGSISYAVFCLKQKNHLQQGHSIIFIPVKLRVISSKWINT